MATPTGVRSVNASLSGTTVDTVTLTGSGRRIAVVNQAAAGGADMWVTFSTTTTAPPTPVAAAEEAFWIPPGGFKVFANAGGGCIVKILGNGNAYSVEEDAT